MIKLRTLELKDMKYMKEYYCVEEYRKYYVFNRLPLARMEIRDSIETFIRSSWEDKKNVHFAIVNLCDEYLGTISLKNLNFLDRTAEYAIIIRKDYWGKGVAHNATNEILFYAFNLINLNKIYLNVLANNSRAILFYEKYGFKKEGVFKKHLFYYGEYVDLVWYSIFCQDFKQKSDYNNIIKLRKV